MSRCFEARVSISTALIVFAVAAVSIAVADDARPEPAFHISLDNDPRDGSPGPTFVRARYDVEVYAGMASAKLVQEYRNGAREQTRAAYVFVTPGSVQLGRVTLTIDGDLRDIAIGKGDALKPARNTPQGEARKFHERLMARRRADDAREAARLERLHRLNLQSSRRGDPVTLETSTPRAYSALLELSAGTAARVDTRFQLPLTLEGGRFRLVLPAVIDASLSARKTPEAQPVPLGIVVTVNHPQRLLAVESPSHEILYDFAGDRTIVETVQTEVPGNRPFELEFVVAAEHESNAASFVREVDGDRREVVTVLTPPQEPLPGSERPKQLVFVVDTSGSMARETKMHQARKAVRYCVDKLQPEDRFNIIEFDGDFDPMHHEPVEPTQDERESAHAWLRRLVADGKTLLLPALEEAIAQLEDRERHRMIIVVTDGALQDETPVLQLLRDELGDIRLFAVGAGDHVRQSTLLRLAEFGRGAAAFANDSDSFEDAVAELFDRVSEPLGWDLEFDWGGAEVESILPSRLPDLYVGRPVRVVAWVRGDLPSAVRVKMSTTDGDARFNVRLPPLDLPLSQGLGLLQRSTIGA